MNVSCANVWLKHNVGATRLPTLTTNGRPLGIRFQDPAEMVNEADIHRTFMQFAFPESAEAAFAASLKAEH